MTQLETGARDGFSVVMGSRPYPWPWDGRIEPPSLALLVIQAPGSPVLPSRPRDTMGQLADRVARAGGSVIEVMTRPPFRRGTPWLHESAAASTWLPDTTSPDAVIHSPGWNGFFDSTLDIELRRRGATHLLLTGFWLEIGVHSTMRSGNDMGYECLLVEDSVVPFDPTLTAASLSSIEMSGGIFGAIATSSAVIDAIRIVTSTERSEHD